MADDAYGRQTRAFSPDIAEEDAPDAGDVPARNPRDLIVHDATVSEGGSSRGSRGRRARRGRGGGGSRGGRGGDGGGRSGSRSKNKPLGPGKQVLGAAGGAGPSSVVSHESAPRAPDTIDAAMGGKPVPKPRKGVDQIKVVVIGDAAVGKTSMLLSFVEGRMPDQYIPTVFDNHVKSFVVDDEPIELSLWDTAGQEDYDKLRPFSYRDTDVFLVVFSLLSEDSLNNLKNKWIPELEEHAYGVPYVVVGNKSDLREDKRMIRELSERGKKPVDFEDAVEAARTMKAYRYIECSALTGENLPSAFEEVVRCYRYFKDPDNKKKCVIS